MLARNECAGPMRALRRVSSLILVGLLVFCGRGSAKVTLDTSGKGELINMYGKISRADAEQFTKIVKGGQVKVPLLILQNSIGGDASAALDIGRMARKNNFAVWSIDKCLSACTLIYIAGVDRKNFGIIGLHRPYLVGRPMPTSQVAAATQKMLADIRKYVAEMNVTEEFSDIMINTDPANVRLFIKDEIEKIVPRYDPIYSELKTAYWARVYGISTEEFRRRDADAEAKCGDTGPSDVAGITIGQMCTLATYWGMDTQAFEPVYKLALQMCGTVEAASLPNLSASNWDNPMLVQNENCIRTSMQMPQRPVWFVIQPQYALALSFQEGVARVDDGDWHVGFIDKSGRYVISPKFIDARSFKEGLAAVQLADGGKDPYGAPTGKWGFVDKQGHVVIDARYRDVDSFRSGFAAVRIGDKWGFIDRNGRAIIRPQFDWAGQFQSGMAPVNVESKWGFIDSHGSFIIKPQFARAHEFQEGMAAIALPDKSGVERWGFIDTLGRIVVKPQFDDVEEFEEGVAAVGAFDSGWKWGFIDKQGKFTIKPIFDWCESFQSGLAAVKIDDKWGLIDKRGYFTIRPQFEWADSYSEGLARVQVGGKWGFIAQ